MAPLIFLPGSRPLPSQSSQRGQLHSNRGAGTLTLAEAGEEVEAMLVRLGRAIGQALIDIEKRAAADRAERWIGR